MRLIVLKNLNHSIVNVLIREISLVIFLPLQELVLELLLSVTPAERLKILQIMILGNFKIK